VILAGLSVCEAAVSASGALFGRATVDAMTFGQKPQRERGVVGGVAAYRGEQRHAGLSLPEQFAR
jgi:hypothetical protein